MTELRDAVAAAKEFLEWIATDGDETVQVIREDDVEAAVTAAISAWNRRADDWQPIETAPRDGTEVLVYATMPDHLQWADPDKQLRPVTRVTAWHPDAGWCVDELREASHWRPLPKGPGG